MAARFTAATAFLCLLATSAWAEKPRPSDPAPAASGVTDKAWPITLTDAKSIKPEGKPAGWRQEEIAEAVANCKVLLDGLDVVAIPEAPMREGGRCGSAAPMKLVSIGRGAQQVTFAPHPIVSCDMIAGLARWLQQDVQPTARRYLGSPVARIETMSSYSCRNAYGRSHGRLSEHGRANALDIGAFATEKSQIVGVETDWGMTAREVAALRKDQETQRAQQYIKPVEAAPTLASKPVQNPHVTTLQPVAPAQPVGPSLPGITFQFSNSLSPPALGFGPPNRLGGPKPRNAPSAVIPPPPPEPRASAATQGKLEFLRAVHKGGCRTFGTVLGPEADRTHRNHFHVDMAERVQNLKVCE